MEIIQLQNIKKHYGEKVVFQDVNLNISAGFFTVLRGESGAGKSTLLNLIGGLEMPTSGQIIVDGKDVGNLTAKSARIFIVMRLGLFFRDHIFSRNSRY